MKGQKASAVFITSPTYHGICSNLSEISELCHSHGIPLIVDEAHGAHFGFHAQLPNSALQQGADLAIQSTHKVLCSLTQSSMLHMSGNLVDRERICKCLQMLQSTSPSYLLLASLDAARAQLGENPRTIFNEAIEMAIGARDQIGRIPGISILDFRSFSAFPVIDPLRVTIGTWKLGLSGFEADDMLFREYQIMSELVGTHSITFAINLGTRKEHVQKLVLGMKHLSNALLPMGIEEDRVQVCHCAPFDDVNISLNPREAFFASKRRMAISNCLGQISGELICPYPPGIPVLIPGEVITRRSLDYLLQVQREGAVISGASDPLLSTLIVCNV
ncbi:Orn/Lys/Arg decarboxylase, major domain [Dillenia turbinata]|uniref:Orn/Lys/Arg decarboxylase, major domain n=1 Tax=Dillenia turbinata TaxID=194707 RepID=A0AAN8ZNW4_9MAGN